MTATRLILLLLLVLVAVVIVVVVLRRGSARRDAQRVEAAGLRTEADTIATTLAGQAAFADQAAERAELARVEAEEKAREAARLESEAAEHRATLDATQRDYEATMRRADDIDPDVKESAFPAVSESDADQSPLPGVSEPGQGGDDAPMTRAERREARDAGRTEGAGSAAQTGEAGTAGPVSGAAAGASAWAGRGDGDGIADSERVASAADFRDDTPVDPAQEPTRSTADAAPQERRDVYAGADVGSEPHMSDDARTGTEEAGGDDGLMAGGAAAAAAGAGTGAGAAAIGGLTAARAAGDDAGTTDDAGDGAAEGSTATAGGEGALPGESAPDVSHDVESPRGEWGGPHQDDGADSVDDTGMTVIAEPEAFAATEPVMAQDQARPVTPEDSTAGDHQATDGEPARTADPAAGTAATDEGTQATGDGTEATGDGTGTTGDITDDAQHAPAEAGAAVAETDGSDPVDRSPADIAEQPAQERFDPTPTRDWAADEGELLSENSERAERLEAERDELAAADEESGSTASELVGDEPTRPGRRISDFHELRDGGYGVGSAAPLDDHAQPLDHPVQGNRDSMTFWMPGDAGYDSTEPHVWFYDQGAAERSGFRRAEG